MSVLLDVTDLTVTYPGTTGAVGAVRGASFAIARGETLALVGEAGSGKSSVAHALLGLAGSARVTGSALFEGRDLLAMPERRVRAIRGAEIAMIFQHPHASFHPSLTVGWQIAETLRIHTGAGRVEARRRATDLLELVAVPDAAHRLDAFPHEFSGGMLQRAMIARAIALRPRLLIADEPTTALDATVQADILRLLRSLQHDLGMAILLITHDFGVVANSADDVCLMRDGRTVETAPVRTMLTAPRDAYAANVLKTLRALEAPRPATMRVGADTRPLVRVEHVSKVYAARSRSFVGRPTDSVHAVHDVSFDIRRGETLSLVGETGSGKTTLARCIAGLMPVTSGRIAFDGTDLAARSGNELRSMRRHIQLVFQDPYGSLNPRHRIGPTIAEPLVVHGVGTADERRLHVLGLLERVGLPRDVVDRYPAELSGGQRQRVGIARAIALGPALVICDEPVSALDVSIRAQLLDLLADLQQQLGLTYLFISHDLSVVRHVSDRVAVMHRGSIVELADTAAVFDRPAHPYTRQLLDAMLSLDAPAAGR